MKGYTPNLVVLAVALNFHILHLNHIIQITVLKFWDGNFAEKSYTLLGTPNSQVLGEMMLIKNQNSEIDKKEINSVNLVMF